MAIVAVFFQQPGMYAYPLHTQPYRQRFAELACEIERLGAQLRVVREQSSYIGEGLFKQGWKYVYGRLLPAGKVRANVIFDKGYFVSDDSVPVFNPPALNHLCTDKYLTATTFSGDSPHTQYIASEAEFQAAIQHQPDRLKVVKPLDGLGGEGVYIGTASELQAIDRNYPCLVQEFLDTSGGIANITKHKHDLRIAILNGDITYALVRTPPPGQLVASTGLGASIRAIDQNRLPTIALDVVERVERKLSAYTQRFYSIDLAFVNGQPKIIELNSRVGLGDSSWHPDIANTKRKLAKTLVNIATNKTLVQFEK